MTPAGLLAALAGHGVSVSLLDDGALRLAGMVEPPAPLMAELRAHKAAVVAALAARPPGAPCPSCGGRWWAGEGAPGGAFPVPTQPQAGRSKIPMKPIGNRTATPATIEGTWASAPAIMRRVNRAGAA